MIEKIYNEAQYNSTLSLIDKLTTSATTAGGFDFLTEAKKSELAELSLLAEEYEDDVLKIMPLPFATIPES